MDYSNVTVDSIQTVYASIRDAIMSVGYIAFDTRTPSHLQKISREIFTGLQPIGKQTAELLIAALEIEQSKATLGDPGYNNLEFLEYMRTVPDAAVCNASDKSSEAFNELKDDNPSDTAGVTAQETTEPAGSGSV